jgi:hypothetical protein
MPISTTAARADGTREGLPSLNREPEELSSLGERQVADGESDVV